MGRFYRIIISIYRIFVSQGFNSALKSLDCFALLAMTIPFREKRLSIINMSLSLKRLTIDIDPISRPLDECLYNEIHADL